MCVLFGWACILAWICERIRKHQAQIMEPNYYVTLKKLHARFFHWLKMDEVLISIIGEIGQTGVGAKDRKHSKRPHEEDVVD